METNKTKLISLFWMTLLVIVFVSLNYRPDRGIWVSFLATFLIILFAYLAWSRKFLYILGLKINQRESLLTLLVLALVLPCAYCLISLSARAGGVQFTLNKPAAMVHYLFYTLNEEIVLGALFLRLLKTIYKKVHAVGISIMAAASFAGIHYLMYRWIFQDNGSLLPLVLVSLLAIGIVRNNLILTCGHIGYAWAIHFSWIAMMLGFSHTWNKSMKSLSDLELFNLHLGAPKTVIVAAILMLISFSLFFKKEKNDSRF